MKTITHKQAVRLINLRMDEILKERQRALLEEHLASCDVCRLYASKMELLPHHLQHEFHTRWDANPGPSHKLLGRVTTNARRIPMAKQVSAGIKLLTGAAALILLGITINFVASQLRGSSVASNETLVPSGETDIPASQTNGDLIAFDADSENGDRDIYVVHSDGSGLTNLTADPGDDYAPIWSADGTKIAFVSMRDGNEEIYAMNADGRDLVRLTQDSNPDINPVWSPNGRKIAYTSRQANTNIIFITDSDKQNSHPLTRDVPGTVWPTIWSADNQSVFFGIGTQIVKADVDSGATTFLTPETDIAGDFNWSPDGTHLFYLATCGENVADFCDQVKSVQDDGTGEETHETMKLPRVCPGGTPEDPTGFYYMTRWSPDRTRIMYAFYCENTGGRYFVANADGSDFRALSRELIPYQGLEFGWSADSQSIVFSSILDNGQKSDLYLLNVNAALQNPDVRPAPLNLSVSKIASPAWQPRPNNELVEEKPTPQPTPASTSEALPNISTGIANGEWIAFIGTRFIADPIYPTALTDSRDVYLIRPDGNGLMNVTNSPDYYYWPAWSPNGKNLLFLRSSGTVDILRRTVPAGFEVLVNTGMNAEVNAETRTVERPFSYSWSPNNEQIAYIDNQSGNYDIYTIYADGRNDPQLTQLTDDPAQDGGFVWSPDGNQIAYQRTDGEQLSIMVMNADGSNQHEVAHGGGEMLLHWSMDGDSIYANSAYGWPPEAKIGYLECEGCVAKSAVYRIDLHGPSTQQIYYEEDTSKVQGWILYDTPQNTLYIMSTEVRDASVGLWGTWKYWDGSTIHEIDAIDPRQTCKTTSGNILNEHISPNKRYSIISNYCAGGFDLYLADRENSDPEKKLIHLLRLPLDTWGEGGDGATLPIQWSPDGRWLIYNDESTTYLLDIEKAMQDPDAALTSLIEPILYTGTDGLQYQSSETIFASRFAWQPAP